MANHFQYRDGELFAEETPLSDLAKRYGTPLYVYSTATFERHYRAWQQPLGERGMVCYSVKANSNIALLSLLANMGSGFDIVSGGELERVLKAGGSADRIVFSGVGKTRAEMIQALEAQIHCFNVESEAELERLNSVARDLEVVAPISLRVNPDVDAQTHPYISTGLSENKFGVDIAEAESLYLGAMDMQNVKIVGIDCHIGSQLTSLDPYLDALDRLLILVDRLEEKGIELEHLDLGGGLGVKYRDETPPLPSDYARGIFQRMGQRSQRIFVEPGRSIAANAGVLLTKVEYIKQGEEKNFAIVDAGMNDLIRPSLYQAWMDISAVRPRSDGIEAVWDVVGPVCETGDFLGKERRLNITQGDLLAVHSAGAYSFVMTSNYNTRPKPAEVLVDGEQHYLVRARQTTEEMLSGEEIPRR